MATGDTNPDWTRDEHILALDFFYDHFPNIPGKKSAELADLAADILRLASRLGLRGDSTFRNLNGVYMKQMNFLRLHPQHAARGRKGLTRGSKGEAMVWSEFLNRRGELSVAAATIRTAIRNDYVPPFQGVSSEDEETAEAPEGRLVTRIHLSRERNRGLVRRKKDDVLRRLGKLECEACGFDFAVRYPTRGRGFAECHHTKPLRDLVGTTTTRLRDLAIVCANCHRMIHAAAPWLTIEELRAIIILQSDSGVGF